MIIHHSNNFQIAWVISLIFTLFNELPFQSMYERNEDWKNIFHVARINAPSYIQEKTFTWANHEDGSSKLVHLICNQIITECCNSVKWGIKLYHSQQVCLLHQIDWCPFCLVGVHNDYLEYHPELKQLPKKDQRNTVVPLLSWG